MPLGFDPFSAIVESLVAGESEASGTDGRREFICQEGRIYARIRLGSGKKRTKENGGYIYKGHVSKYEGDPRWENRLREYATRHECHYPHADLAEYRGKPSGIGVGFDRSDEERIPLAIRTPKIEGWRGDVGGGNLPSKTLH